MIAAQNEPNSYALCMLDQIGVGTMHHHGQLGHNCPFTQLERAGFITMWTVSGHGKAHVVIEMACTPSGLELVKSRIEARRCKTEHAAV